MRRMSPRTTALLSGGLFLLSAADASGAAVSMTAQAAQQAEGFANSAIYNGAIGMSLGQENRAISGSNRDANGNLLIVNGIMSGTGNVNQQDGLHQAGSGNGPNSASATAVGNSLNVTVTGAWNTVIVDSTQINNGDQNASASLNGSLNF